MTDVNLEYIAKEHEHLKNELQRSYEKRAEGAIFRSKVLLVEEGEKPTKYFFHMERTNFNKKVITELKVTKGTNIVDEEKLSEEIKLFYKYLFTSTNHITDETFQEFPKKTPIKSRNYPMKKTTKLRGS